MTMQETWIRSLGREGPLEKEMATHSCILVWEIPWIEEPGRLESTGLHTVGHDLATEQQQQKFTRKKIVKTYKIQASVFIIRVSIHKIIFVKLL